MSDVTINDALDRTVLDHYLGRAATYHERKDTKVLIAGTTMQRLLALCGERVPKRVAKAYSLTPALNSTFEDAAASSFCSIGRHFAASPASAVEDAIRCCAFPRVIEPSFKARCSKANITTPSRARLEEPGEGRVPRK